MKVANAEFVVSNAKVELCPKSKLPEYAFIGRSNVGKSSLINMLCNKKKLAKTSSRPSSAHYVNGVDVKLTWMYYEGKGKREASRLRN